MFEHDLTRRGFLGDLAAAAAAFSAGRAAEGLQAEPPKALRTVKFGFIGTGSQGGFALQQALRNPACECVALCDIHPANLAKAAKIAKNARRYGDYREMLEKEKGLEAVAIATPLGSHAPIVLDALDAGKHVFVEQALAHTVEQCKAVCRKAKATGRLVQVGHQRRTSPLYAHAAKLIQKDKVLGQLTTLRAWWHRNADWARPVPQEPPPIDLQKWGYETLDQLINWRLYTRYSGGLLAELAGHQIDVVNWMLGMTPTRVTGIGGLNWYDWAKLGRDEFDNVHCIFEYPGGVKLLYSSITTNEYEGYGEAFVGREGTLIIEGCTHGLLFRGRQPRDTVVDAKTRSPAEDYVDEFASFFDCIRTGQRPVCSEVEGMQSAVTLLKANEALRQNLSIELTPDLYQV